MSRFGIDALRHALFKRLKGSPLVEASCHGHHAPPPGKLLSTGPSRV